MSEYNGWANKATWLVNVHMSNTHAWYEANKALTKQHVNDKGPHVLAEALREDAERRLLKLLGYGDTGRYQRDMMTYAIYEVDWVALAEHYLHDARQ